MFCIIIVFFLFVLVVVLCVLILGLILGFGVGGFCKWWIKLIICIMCILLVFIVVYKLLRVCKLNFLNVLLGILVGKWVCWSLCFSSFLLVVRFLFLFCFLKKEWIVVCVCDECI